MTPSTAVLDLRVSKFFKIEKPLFFAGEATDFSGHNGTVHGAIASGQRAAH